MRKIAVAFGAVFILAFYLFFVWRGAFFYFDNDDMMNLYLAWSKPVMESFRPLGAVFYRAMFGVAGFDPFPFRVVCLFFGAVNIGLCFWFARMVSGSYRMAALAALLFAFHTRMMEVWFRTGVVYDLLCFTFLYLAACLYMSKERVGVWRGVAIVACFVAALGAKENAVVLPLIMLAWRRDRWLPLVCGAIDIPYLWFKTHGPAALTNIAAYQSEFTLTRFAHTWSLYMNYLLVRHEGQIGPRMAFAILMALLAIAVAVRSRALIFAWVALFAPVLPVAFLSYRGAFVLYTSYPGWTVYGAVVLSALVTLAPEKHRMAAACLLFALTAWRWGKLNLHDQRADARPWLYQSAAQVHQMADQMRALEPSLPKGARCLFLKDAFGTDEWTPYFIVKLLYRDNSLTVDRVKMMDSAPDPNTYQYVFTYENARYRQLKP